MSLLMHLAVLAAPTPSGSGAPSFGAVEPTFAAAKFGMVVGWAVWFATGLCGLAFVIIGTQLAFAIRRGETGEHLTKLGAAAAGVVIVGAASQIVGALL